MLIQKKEFKNIFIFINLMHSVIELSLGEYGNSINPLIKLVDEQNQNDRLIVGK